MHDKSFWRLAIERLVSNLLSVKVWLFLIPTAASIFFMYWSMDQIVDNTIYLQQQMGDSPLQILELSKHSLNMTKDLFTSWLKFIGSLTVSIVGVREVWKVAKIKEDRKKEKMRQDEDSE